MKSAQEPRRVYGGGRWDRCADPSKSTYRILDDPGEGRGPCIRFFPCGVTSYNLKDIEQRYCALCQEWIKTAARPTTPARS